MDVAEVFATNVRNFRRARGLSQEKLGEAAGLHRTYIGNIEQQAVNPSLSSVGKIAEALDVPLALLLMSTDNDPTAIAPLSHAGEGPNRGSDLHGPNRGKDVCAGGDSGALSDAEAQRVLDNYALATFTDEGIRLQPLTVRNPSLSLQLLATLVLQGQPEEAIPELYSRLEREAVSVLMRTRVAGQASSGDRNPEDDPARSDEPPLCETSGSRSE